MMVHCYNTHLLAETAASEILTFFVWQLVKPVECASLVGVAVTAALIGYADLIHSRCSRIEVNMHYPTDALIQRRCSTRQGYLTDMGVKVTTHQATFRTTLEVDDLRF
jgi:hypothetical protein